MCIELLLHASTVLGPEDSLSEAPGPVLRIVNKPDRDMWPVL